jgi:hypothetical protein
MGNANRQRLGQHDDAPPPGQAQAQIKVFAGPQRLVAGCYESAHSIKGGAFEQRGREVVGDKRKPLPLTVGYRDGPEVASALPLMGTEDGVDAWISRGLEASFKPSGEPPVVAVDQRNPGSATPLERGLPRRRRSTPRGSPQHRDALVCSYRTLETGIASIATRVVDDPEPPACTGLALDRAHRVHDEAAAVTGRQDDVNEVAVRHGRVLYRSVPITELAS